MKHIIPWATCAALGLLVLTISGCNVAGPASITSGRAVYAEAITRTNDQQMLATIVRSRYGETASLLAVTNIAANMRVAATAGIDIGFGPSENYDGNLVPLSAGVAYEENPTITYTPVQGATYLHELLSPTPLELLVLLMRSSEDPAFLTTILVERMNDLHNPLFYPNDADPSEAGFHRVSELLGKLSDEGALDWVKTSEDEGFAMLIRGADPSIAASAEELMTLLDLPAAADERGQTIIPVELSAVRGDGASIAIATRSLSQLIRLAAAAVEVPEDHVASGLARPDRAAGQAGALIRIRRSETEPKDAAIVVRQHGNWYYIDGRDQESKLFFRLLSGLWTARIADASGDSQTAPVLTVPVSR